ncbi:MAG: flagellar export chaperone FliS [Phycisphaerae bacterium]
MSEPTENPYLRDAVLTATPEQLQLMLYDGAIRYGRQARDALLAKDYETSYDRLTRAQNIIAEMQVGLNHEANPALCAQVASVYGFLFRKFLDANVKHDVQAVDDALKVLCIERETWRIVVDKVSKVRQTQMSDSKDDADPDDEQMATSGFSVEG